MCSIKSVQFGSVMYGVRCAQFIRNDDVTRIIAKFTTRARPDPTGEDPTRQSPRTLSEIRVP